jgi:hypothetical protein
VILSAPSEKGESIPGAKRKRKRKRSEKKQKYQKYLEERANTRRSEGDYKLFAVPGAGA